MNTTNQISKKYLTELRADLGRLKKGFLYIRNSMRAMESNSFTENKMKKVEELLNDFGWRIDHIEKSENYPADVIHQSFSDLENEIDWRLKELKMIRNGKTVPGDSVTEPSVEYYQGHED